MNTCERGLMSEYVAFWQADTMVLLLQLYSARIKPFSLYPHVRVRVCAAFLTTILVEYAEKNKVALDDLKLTCTITGVLKTGDMPAADCKNRPEVGFACLSLDGNVLQEYRIKNLGNA